MLVRDGNAWILPANPQAVAKISRVSLVTGIVCALVAGWALLCALAVLIFGDFIFTALSPDSSTDTAPARWGIGIGILVCAVVFAVVAVYLFVRDWKLKHKPTPAVITIDQSGVSVVGKGGTAYADMVSIAAHIGDRPILWATTPGGTAGNEIAARVTGRPKVVHELLIHRRNRRPMSVDLAMHTSAQGFVELVGELGRIMEPYRIPVRFQR